MFINDRRKDGLLNKIRSRSFIAWAVSCSLTFTFCFRNGDHVWLNYLVVGNIIVTALFICGRILVEAISKFVENGKLEVTL